VGTVESKILALLRLAQLPIATVCAMLAHSMPATNRRQRMKRRPHVTNQMPSDEGTRQPVPRPAGTTGEAPAVSPVPPGSTALREFCHVVTRALTLPDPAIWPGTSPAGPDGEMAYLRLCRDRARLVAQTMQRILHDREIDDRDIMIFVASLREELADRPADRENQAGGSS
jgi:hypothetical protein